jgi:hypothetical protein
MNLSPSPYSPFPVLKYRMNTLIFSALPTASKSCFQLYNIFKELGLKFMVLVCEYDELSTNIIMFFGLFAMDKGKLEKDLTQRE